MLWENMSRVVEDVSLKTGAILTKITSVQDPHAHAIKQLQKNKLNIEDEDEVWAFHGTSEQSALDMAKNGIKPVCGRCLWGKGFYTTTISKLALYYSARNIKNEFTIVLCRVAKGKTAVGAPNMVPAGDVNTLIGQNEASSFLVSPDSNLVLIRYIVNFKLDMMRPNLLNRWDLPAQLNAEYKAKLPYMQPFYKLINEMIDKRQKMIPESTPETEKADKMKQNNRAYIHARSLYPNPDDACKFLREEAMIFGFRDVDTIINRFLLVANFDEQKEFLRQHDTLKLIEANQDSQVAENELKARALLATGCAAASKKPPPAKQCIKIVYYQDDNVRICKAWTGLEVLEGKTGTIVYGHKKNQIFYLVRIHGVEEDTMLQSLLRSNPTNKAHKGFEWKEEWEKKLNVPLFRCTAINLTLVSRASGAARGAGSRAEGQRPADPPANGAASGAMGKRPADPQDEDDPNGKRPRL
jgi:hypothetical protein